MKMIRLEFKIQDLWIGAFWKRDIGYVINESEYIEEKVIIQHLWICLVPCFPIHIQWRIDDQR